MGKNPPEWQKFKVGQPSSKPDWVNSDCQLLDSVFHIAHIPVALEILRVGSLVPRLVYDKSKLNQRRITVTWLSPNYWHQGSRYGNVQFKFNWKKLVNGLGKRFYWVEAIDEYNPTACRILITKQDHSNEPDLVKYDPESGDGPWWWNKSDDTHWWNGKYCLEIMAEGELPVAKCEAVNFVDHHLHGCCINHKTCQDKGLDKEKAGSLFLAAAVSQEMDISSLNLIVAGTKKLSEYHPICRAWSAIWLKTKKLQFSGTVTAKMSVAIPLVKAFLGAYSRSQSNKTDYKDLVQLFASAEEFRAAFEKLFEVTFGLPPANLDGEIF